MYKFNRMHKWIFARQSVACNWYIKHSKYSYLSVSTQNVRRLDNFLNLRKNRKANIKSKIFIWIILNGLKLYYR